MHSLLMNIKLKIIEETFSVCKVKDYSEIDLQAAFVFVGSKGYKIC